MLQAVQFSPPWPAAHTVVAGAGWAIQARVGSVQPEHVPAAQQRMRSPSQPSMLVVPSSCVVKPCGQLLQLPNLQGIRFVRVWHRTVALRMQLLNTCMHKERATARTCR